MGLNFKTIFTGLKIKAKAILTSDTKGELEVSDSTGKLNYHDGLTRSPVVTESHTATLTNKTIDADNNTVSNLEVDNLKAGVLNTSTNLAGASDTQVPSALAVKTYIDDGLAHQNEASEITYDNSVSGLAATNAQDAIDEVEARVDTAESDITAVENALQAHITNPSDAHDASAISNDPSGNLAATTVQAALNELQTDIDTRATQSDLANHINQVTDAHDASAISVSPTVDLVSTTVQAALEELQAEVIAASGSAAGVQTNLDNHINDTVDAHDASAISVVPAGNLAATEVQAALVELQTDIDTRALSSDLSNHISDTSTHGVTGDIVGTSDTQTLTNKTIDADLNTITNIENADIKAGAAIDRSKLASGTANKVLVNDGTGAMSEMVNVTDSANALILSNLKHIELQSQDDATSTGSDATLATFTAGGVRITNAGLVSLSNIPVGANGQQFVLFNRTGNSITIIDSSTPVGAPGARILTGTNANITLANNAALILSYDSVSNRWQVVGGSGGGSGSATSAVDNVFTINDATDPTKQINFDAGGTTATKTTITASQTANRVLTLPDATDTLVSRTSTDTLTNKTIVAANNTITTAASGNLASTELNASLAELQGDINLLNTNPNYILNNEFSVNVNGWATYSDAAGTSPVDGTGGTANVTFTRTTSTPLFGIASALLTKDAVNRQGQGFSYDFTIDEGMKTKVNTIRFDYQIASGTYATGDLTVWIYDVTNGALIQPAPYQIQNSGIIETFISEFQATTSLSYRLIVHVSSTSASAYTVKFDNFYVGRAPKVYGSVVTDWVSYTPTLTNGGTTSTNTGKWRRVGDSIEIQTLQVFTGSGTAGNFTVSPPAGVIFDTTKTNTTNNIGSSSWYDASVAQEKTGASVGISSGAFAGFFDNNGSTTLQGNAIASGDYVRLHITLPVVGWSSSQQLSQDADTRVIAAKYTTNQARTSTSTPFNYETKIFDTHGAVTTGASWKFTAPVAGIYRVSAGFIAQSSSTVNHLYVSKNNVIYDGGALAHQVATNVTVRGTTLIEMKAGDFLHLSNGSGSTATLAADSSVNSIEVERISGPSQIAASESVVARYTQSSGQSIPNNSDTTVVFPSKVFDTHNAFNGSTGVFTAPISGKYQVSARITYANNGTGRRLFKLAKNVSTTDMMLDYRVSGSSTYLTMLVGSTTVSLLQGETIQILTNQDSGGSLVLHVDSVFNDIVINRVGNY